MLQLQRNFMPKYCRDQARDELWLMMGGGAAIGIAGGYPTVFIFPNTCYFVNHPPQLSHAYHSHP